jgi:glucan phosphoethanolaminetransferase (alkaline phosphatase superfamily)
MGAGPGYRQNATMSLKLFRSTGYESILSPGETRAAMHPGWVIAAISVWAGFACNVALWRELWAGDKAGLAWALVLGAFIAAVCAVFLSVLGWRKTLKPAATLILFVAALTACAIWGQAIPVDASLLQKRLSTLILPSWASLLRWQVSALLMVLALAPTIWLWNTQVRRLPGPQQLSINMMGILLASILVAGSGFLLFRGSF